MQEAISSPGTPEPASSKGPAGVRGASTTSGCTPARSRSVRRWSSTPLPTPRAHIVSQKPHLDEGRSSTSWTTSVSRRWGRWRGRTTVRGPRSRTRTTPSRSSPPPTAGRWPRGVPGPLTAGLVRAGAARGGLCGDGTRTYVQRVTSAPGEGHRRQIPADEAVRRRGPGRDPACAGPDPWRFEDHPSARRGLQRTRAATPSAARGRSLLTWPCRSCPTGRGHRGEHRRQAGHRQDKDVVGKELQKYVNGAGDAARQGDVTGLKLKASRRRATTPRSTATTPGARCRRRPAHPVPGSAPRARKMPWSARGDDRCRADVAHWVANLEGLARVNPEKIRREASRRRAPAPWACRRGQTSTSARANGTRSRHPALQSAVLRGGGGTEWPKGYPGGCRRR